MHAIFNEDVEEDDEEEVVEEPAKQEHLNLLLQNHKFKKKKL